MTIGPGTYRIKNALSGTYLDNSARDPSIIHGWANRPNSRDQEWIVEGNPGEGYTLKNVASGSYASASGPGDGTPVRATGEQTRWDFRADQGAYLIAFKGINTVIDLDMGRSENGTSISLWGSTGARQQVWEFEQVQGSAQNSQSAGLYRGGLPPGRYTIHNIHSGTALDLAAGSPADGTPIIGYQVGTGINQEWEFVQGQSGYLVKNVAAGSYASHRAEDAVAEGTLLAGNNSVRVEWDVRQADQGYQFAVPGTDLVLDLADGSAENGAKVCMWTNNNQNNQKWDVRSV